MELQTESLSCRIKIIFKVCDHLKAEKNHFLSTLDLMPPISLIAGSVSIKCFLPIIDHLVYFLMSSNFQLMLNSLNITMLSACILLTFRILEFCSGCNLVAHPSV